MLASIILGAATFAATASAAPLVERAAGTYAVFANYDAHQGAYAAKQTPTLDGCLQACKADAICQTFTWVSSTSTCWMASTFAPSSAGPSQGTDFGIIGGCSDPSVQSGIAKNSFASDLQDICGDDAIKVFQPRTDDFAVFGGFDANQGVFASQQAASLDACVSACRSARQCKTFTYVESTTTCWLSSVFLPSSAGPSAGTHFGLIGGCANSAVQSGIAKNSYASSLQALCGNNAINRIYAYYSDYDQRQGSYGVASYPSAQACGAAAATEGATGFTYDGSNCYKSKISALGASSPNAGKTMGYLGTCASTKNLLPAQFRNTACTDALTSA